MERESSQQKKQEEIKRKIDEKIDQFNKQTFPASDPPQWDSLQDELRELTNRNESKGDSADRPK
jgi:hypothetical protein